MVGNPTKSIMLETFIELAITEEDIEGLIGKTAFGEFIPGRKIED